MIKVSVVAIAKCKNKEIKGGVLEAEHVRGENLNSIHHNTLSCYTHMFLFNAGFLILGKETR